MDGERDAKYTSTKINIQLRVRMKVWEWENDNWIEERELELLRLDKD